MTASKLSAGDGYAYYVRETVTADVRRQRGQELGDYYLDGGTPAGVWVGKGTATLGVSGEVTESQMKSLFGVGMHPDAEQTMGAMIAAGASSKEAMDWAQLGRKYATFQTPSSELSRALTDAVAQAEAAKGGALDAGERRAVRSKTAAMMFRDRHGRSPQNPQELTRWMGAELRKGQQPVAGFDCTFSAPKSVSVLWAAGDDATRKAVEGAHEAAMNDALAYLEDHATFARTGAGGARSVAVEGLVGTRFRHWTSREGDPQLHDHMVISNKVRRADMDPNAAATDGWLTLDGQRFYRNIQAASSVYDRALATHMKTAGFPMENRQKIGSNKLRMEVVGISDETIAEFSGRRARIVARATKLIGDWEKQHKTTAGPDVVRELTQRATLETRPVKDHAETLAAVQADTRARLGQRLPQTSPWARFTSQRIHVKDEAKSIVQGLTERRSHWTDAHMETAINLWAADHGASEKDVQRVRKAVARQCVTLTPESSAPEILRPVDRVRWHTSSAILDAESTVLDAADQLVMPSVSAAQFDQAMAAHVGPVDEGQLALARTFAMGERLVEAGIGPAGAGKTTAMKLTVEAVAASGHRVIGLSTNARAAEVFATETGAPAHSLAMWTTQRGRDQVPAEYALRAGDVLVVDEASMASSTHLAAVVKDARKAGAFVRLLGDPAQLGAVESGGLLRELDRRHGATRLESLWRFTDVDEAAAGTRLAADGDVRWYLDHDRVHGIRPDQLAETVMGEWFTASRAGQDVAVMASTNAEVTGLNQAGQRLMLDAGLVDHTRTVGLRAGQVAGVGDTILTRKIARKIRTSDGKDFVRNGDRWQVQRINKDGSVEAVGTTGRRITLPAKYLRDETQLGYASTVHVAQGRTVDKGIVVATESTDRNALYVGVTRGRTDNQVFVPLAGQTAEQVVTQAARRSSTSLSAHEVMAQQQALVDSPAELVRAFRVITAEADRPRFDAHIRDAYKELYGPGREVEAADAADALIGSESRAALDNALRRGEAEGFSVGRLIAAAAPDGVTAAEDPARVVAWRIDQHLTRAHQDTPAGPLASYSDAQLTALAERTAAEKAEARAILHAATSAQRTEAAPVTMKNGEQAPAWTDRPFGHLTRDDLAAALDDAQAAVTDSTAQVREARDDLATAREQWAQANQTGQRLDPATAAAAERLAGAEHTLAATTETDRMARGEYAGLRAEQQTRRRMTGTSWAQETRSRDLAAARQDVPSSRYVDPAEAQRHRYATGAEVEAAHGQLDRARIIDRQVTAEQATRLRVPDQAEPYRHELPTWAGVSNALHDPAVPAHQRAELTQAAQWIGAQITQRGEAIATDPSCTPWARELGPVPTDPDRRARWAQLAGRIDTYRQLAGYTQPDRTLPIPQAGTRQATETHTLRAAMSDLRIETTQAQRQQQEPTRATPRDNPWTRLRGQVPTAPAQTSTATLARDEDRTVQRAERVEQDEIREEVAGEDHEVEVIREEDTERVETARPEAADQPAETPTRAATPDEPSRRTSAEILAQARGGQTAEKPEPTKPSNRELLERVRAAGRTQPVPEQDVSTTTNRPDVPPSRGRKAPGR